MDKVDINKSQKKTIEVMTKYTILVFIALFSEFIVGTLSLTRFHLKYGSKKDINILMYPTSICALINCVINILCLQTQFNFWAQKKYTKICKWCHQAAMQPFIEAELRHLQKRKLAMNQNSNSNPNVPTTAAAPQMTSIAEQPSSLNDAKTKCQNKYDFSTTV